MEQRGFLFLDDSHERYMNFLAWIEGFFYGYAIDVEWVKTYDECIQQLTKSHWDTLCLDHDLGTEKTGYDVAKWIEEKVFTDNDFIPPAQVIVHTANTIGRKAIVDALVKINTKVEVEIDVRTFDAYH